MQNNTEIDSLIGKVLSGNASESDKITLENWLTESAENKQYYTETKEVWRVSQQSKFNTAAAWEKVKAQTVEQETIEKPIKVISLKTWLSVAASLLLLVSASFWVWKTQKPSTTHGKVIAWQQYESSVREELLLEDSSKVDLRKGSLLKFPEQFLSEERKVTFEGTGFFSITKNPEKPFVIETPYGTVTVLGTSFLLETNDSLAQLKVYVEEGKVAVTNTNQSAQVVLQAGEMVLVNNGTLVEVDSIPGNIIAWKSNRMKFTNTTLADVITTLEDIYEIEIQVSDSKVLDCRFTGKFHNKTWKKIIKQLSVLYNFQYEIHAKEVQIMGGDAC